MNRKHALMLAARTMLPFALLAPSAALADPPDLIVAVYSGKPQQVKAALDQGAEVNALSASGETALNAAMSADNPEIVKMLLERGADVNLKSKFGGTPLLIAAGRGDTETVRLLIEKGADVNLKGLMGYSPLQAAVYSGAGDNARILFERGADVEAGSDKKLIEAILTGNAEGVRSALAKGADPDGGSPRPLLYAAAVGSAESMSALLDKGARTVDPKDAGFSALHVAAVGGHASVAKLLIEKGIPVESKDQAGRTPLLAAAQAGRTETVKVLLEAGADVNAKSNVGSALVLAKISGKTAVIKTLLDAGAATKGTGDELLIWAAIRGDIEMARLVLDRGLEVTPAQGAAAISMAHGQTELLRLLQEAGVDDAEKLKAWPARRRAQAEREAKLRAEEEAADRAVKKGKPTEALTRYTEILREMPIGSEAEQNLRDKIIAVALSMETAPELPEEAKHHSDRAQAFAKKARSAEDFKSAAAEFEQALLLAPWWASGYFNLALVLEKTQDFDGAIANMNRYLLAAPQASDRGAVKKKIAELEVSKEMAGKDK